MTGREQCSSRRWKGPSPRGSCSGPGPIRHRLPHPPRDNRQEPHACSRALRCRTRCGPLPGVALAVAGRPEGGAPPGPGCPLRRLRWRAYWVFGRRDACRIPDEAEADGFCPRRGASPLSVLWCRSTPCLCAPSWWDRGNFPRRPRSFGAPSAGRILLVESTGKGSALPLPSMEAGARAVGAAPFP